MTFTPIDPERNLANKRRVRAALQAAIDGPAEQIEATLAAVYAPDALTRSSHPVNDQQGVAAIAASLWRPLRQALPDLERRDWLIIGGVDSDSGRDHVAISGFYVGTFRGDLFGIPANRQSVTLRYNEMHRLGDDGRITTSWIWVDYLDLMGQIGYWPIAPSLGSEGQWHAPRTQDALIFTPQDEAASRASHALVAAMGDGLGQFNATRPDRASLDEMGQVNYWHPNFLWYGPAGIGTTRGLRGFEDYHQIPFLTAVPDRGGGGDEPMSHISEGHYSVISAWDIMRATHTGGDWLGLAPTGVRVSLRVMDVYRCGPGPAGALRLCENWVPIDIIEFLHQIGVDVFARLRHQFRQQGAISASEFLVGDA